MGQPGSIRLPRCNGVFTDTDESVRLAAIRPCGGIKDPAAVAPLTECLKRISPARMKLSCDEIVWCTISLVQIGPAATASLIQLLDAPQPAARFSAASAAGALKDRRATKALIRCLDDESVIVQTTAASSLGAIGDPQAIPALLQKLNDDTTAKPNRLPIAGALARMGRSEGLQFLLRMLKSSDWTHREGALREIGFSQVKIPFESIAPLLLDPAYRVRESAKWLVVQLKDPRRRPRNQGNA